MMIKPGEIHVKNPAVLAALMSHTYCPVLMEIVLWVAVTFGTLITEAWRPARHPGDVHATDPGRGMDLRDRVYPDAKAVADAINERWIYDPDRPWKKCCIIHDSGSGVHMHIQSHPNTVRR